MTERAKSLLIVFGLMYCITTGLAWLTLRLFSWGIFLVWLLIVISYTAIKGAYEIFNAMGNRSLGRAVARIGAGVLFLVPIFNLLLMYSNETVWNKLLSPENSLQRGYLSSWYLIFTLFNLVLYFWELEWKWYQNRNVPMG